MLTFKSIKFKNFISVGNYWTEINFIEHPRTLIVGTNGAGKSTVLDAICFAIFNKGLRDMNKPEMVNTITGRDTVVELEFHVSGKDYKIRRGMKPNLMEIYVDGDLLNQPGDTRDYQSFLEKTVIKMNYKSFVQIVILGSANFTPFMKLPQAARRNFIEDLLDIQIFSTMSMILKEKISANKEAIVDNQNQINIIEAKIDIQKKHALELKKNNSELIEGIQSKISATLVNIEALLSENKTLQIECEDLAVDNEKKIASKVKELASMKATLTTKQNSLNKSIFFYEQNDVCPSCTQPIDSLFKKNIIDKKTSKAKEIVTAIETISEKFDAMQSQYTDIMARLRVVNEKQSQITTNNRLINMHDVRIKEHQKEIEGLKKKAKVLKAESYDTEMTALTDQKSFLFDQREYYGAAAVLLKDGGIKTKIIKQYIPIMNKLINHYLSQMDLFVTFSFDENFSEMIKDRTVDNRSYSSFSEGEKMRIDLALLFTWRSISKMRNSASTNIIFFDEILDGSLDNNGTDEFIKILESLTSDNNVFIISHKVDALLDKFPRVLKFEKTKGFSKMRELT